MTPKPVATVPAAIRSGTPAATGLRNTSNRTIIKIGAAINSPLRSASIDDWLTSVPSDGMPARWAWIGACTFARTKSWSGPMTVVMLPPGGTCRSIVIAAWCGLGRSACTCFALGLQGETARVPGRRWSAAASRGPWRSICRAGPVNKTTRASLKLPLRTSRQCADSVPSMNSNEGWTLCSTPFPMTPNATTTTAQATSTGMAWRIAKRATGGINASVLRNPLRTRPGPPAFSVVDGGPNRRPGFVDLNPRLRLPQAGYIRAGHNRVTIAGKGFPSLTLSHETVVALLDGLELFEALSDEEIEALAGKVDTVSWEPGEIVFQEGDVGDACYVIYTGGVKVTRRLVDGQPIALAQVGHGGVVGELALFASERRAGTLQAVDPTTAVAISREDLMAILHGNADAAISMAVHIARLLQRATDRQFAAATSTVNGRILATLLAQVEARQSHHPGEENIELVGSTSDLARSAGTPKDDAARVLHWLENEGVLRVKRGRIIVRSTPALRGYLD